MPVLDCLLKAGDLTHVRTWYHHSEVDWAGWFQTEEGNAVLKTIESYNEKDVPSGHNKKGYNHLPGTHLFPFFLCFNLHCFLNGVDCISLLGVP